MRGELASRVTHLQPRELVLPANLSHESFKLLTRLTGGAQVQGYLAHNSATLGPYSRTMPRDIWWS